MDWIKSYRKNRPFFLIFWIALILRLIAVIFSKGYGMHDDHFLVIETAQSWLDGAEYNNWFLERNTTDTPTILNFFYAGFHYLLFALLEQTGMTDPQGKMFVVRLIHAFWSMLIVYYGYHIARRLAGDQAAWKAGLLLAAFWLMPFFSVRNLVETVCIPFLMAGFYYLPEHAARRKDYLRIFFSSILFGLAFTLRFQTLIIPAGIGLVFLYHKKWKECLLLAPGFILVVLLTHGVTDWIIWGQPFTELSEYISHNIHHRFDYTVAPWYSYILVILGILIPPVSLMIVAGFFASWKKYALLFIPTLIFLVFHSYFPNKQERFILPVLPFLIILGITGWQHIVERYPFWTNRKKIIQYSWAFFWIMNVIMLAFFTGMYSKKARVEAMSYLSKYEHINILVTEDIHRPHASMMPLFYLGQWPQVLTVSEQKPLNDLGAFLEGDPGRMPSFVLFFDNMDLENRVERMKEFIPGLVPETVIEPGAADRLLHWLNPVNANQQVFIYRNPEIVPRSLKKE